MLRVDHGKSGRKVHVHPELPDKTISYLKVDCYPTVGNIGWAPMLEQIRAATQSHVVTKRPKFGKPEDEESSDVSLSSIFDSDSSKIEDTPTI